jgi:D-alanine-D-alanine ligase-like ATP-grasp enzyme
MRADRLRVGVLFGGRSGEHEVSILSARGVMGAMDREKYEVIPIAITKEGTWLAGGDPMRSLLEGPGVGGSVPVALVADPQDPHLLVLEDRGVDGRKRLEVDLFFPILHGPFGEDGTVQGLLELAGVPYVGAGVASSAVGMDKALQKAVFLARGLPVAVAGAPGRGGGPAGGCPGVPLRCEASQPGLQRGRDQSAGPGGTPGRAGRGGSVRPQDAGGTGGGRSGD